MKSPSSVVVHLESIRKRSTFKLIVWTPHLHHRLLELRRSYSSPTLRSYVWFSQYELPRSPVQMSNDKCYIVLKMCHIASENMVIVVFPEMASTALARHFVDKRLRVSLLVYWLVNLLNWNSTRKWHKYTVKSLFVTATHNFLLS